MNFLIKFSPNFQLYPFVMFFNRFPIGHAQVKKWDPPRAVEWSKHEDAVDPDKGGPLIGIIKAWVVPPQQVKYRIPVLPYKSRGRLLFPLCASVSPFFSNLIQFLSIFSQVCQQISWWPDQCGLQMSTHWPPIWSPEGMAGNSHFVSFWIFWNFAGILDFLINFRDELDLALDAGYRVTELHSAYVWDKPGDWSDDLFHDYIRTMLKLKMESSGWPQDCCREDATEEQRAEAREEYLAKARAYGLELNPDNIALNPGMRMLSKLCLNSLWGRWV